LQLSLFLPLKIKLKGHHFYTTVVTEAELQVVMNNLTEHDFQDAFIIQLKHWERCIYAKGDYLRAMVTSRPKAGF
jgi:hypothetical protein